MNNAAMKSGENPLVSVLVCFYNEKLFLEETIQSVFSQDYANWELVLVDDGSTDESTAIALGYASRYPEKVCYVEHDYHQNKGLSASRNAGIKKCRGTYVAFLDGHDVWLPGKLRSQVDIFRSNPGVTVTLEASLDWNSWRGSEQKDDVARVGVAEGTFKPSELMPLLYPLGRGDGPCASGVMIQRLALRRCMFEELFRGVLQIYEEQAFLCKVYLKETVFVSAAFNHQRRLRPSPVETLEHYDSKNYHRVRSYFLYWFRDYLHGQPMRYKAVEKLLRKAQMPYREPLMYKMTVDLPSQVRRLMMRALIRLGLVSYSKSW